MWPITSGLIRACHPVPTAAVTALSAALAVAMGVPPGPLFVLVLAVLAGQLSVGWLNDLVDRDRDRAAGRADKPVATGALTPQALKAPIAVAAAACVVASLALGPAPGLAHLAAVAGAWAYNLGLKRTAWSWVPFALGFGLLPTVIWLVAPADGLPPWWMIIAAALLGVGAHGANVLPDLDADRAAGIVGLPHRLPRHGLRAGTAIVTLAAFTLLVLGPGATPAGWELGALAVACGLAALAAGALGRSLPPRAPLAATILISGLAVVMLLARGATG